MERLICEGDEIEIVDYLEEKGMYTIDMKFNAKDDFDKFLSMYDEHRFGRGIFRFKIGEKIFDGWFGTLKYDKKFNVRIYVAIYNGEEKKKDSRERELYNAEKSIIGIGNAMRELCKALNKNDVLSEEESNHIIETMKTPETLVEFSSMVDDLPLYLKERNETIVEMRG